MSRIYMLGSLALLCCVASPFAAVQGATVFVNFDGVTTGGWVSQTPEDPPVATGLITPVSAADGGNPTGLNGISFTDTDGQTDGFAYFAAPASLLSMDFTGVQLVVGIYIPTNPDPNGTVFPDQVFIEDADGDFVIMPEDTGSPDPIDVDMFDTVQTITIDFDNAAFADFGVDLDEIVRLEIQADFFDGASGLIESYLVAVPEPFSGSLLGLGLLGLAVCQRRRRLMK
jgi:hypothetical protein